jgi:hypothetical protein
MGWGHEHPIVQIKRLHKKEVSLEQQLREKIAKEILAMPHALYCIFREQSDTCVCQIGQIAARVLVVVPPASDAVADASQGE